MRGDPFSGSIERNSVSTKFRRNGGISPYVFNSASNNFRKSMYGDSLGTWVKPDGQLASSRYDENTSFINPRTVLSNNGGNASVSCSRYKPKTFSVNCSTIDPVSAWRPINSGSPMRSTETVICVISASATAAARQANKFSVYNMGPISRAPSLP